VGRDIGDFDEEEGNDGRVIAPGIFALVRNHAGANRRLRLFIRIALSNCFEMNAMIGAFLSGLIQLSSARNVFNQGMFAKHNNFMENFQQK